MNLLRKNLFVDPARQPSAKTAVPQAGPKGPGPGAPTPQAPIPARPGNPVADMARTAGGASPATTQPRTEPSKTTKTSKPRGNTETSGPRSGSAKSAARRQAHTGHATVGPSGREHSGQGSRGFHQQGHADIQDWLPFSAQQSRILRMTRPIPAMGSAKVMPHVTHPLRNAAFSMVKRLYSEVLPSLFRQTPRDVERHNREIRKDVVRKDIMRKDLKKRIDRNEVRREAILKRAESEQQRAMAGDLRTSFATA